QEAEQIYRQIIAVEPNHANALHLLGIVAYQRGKYDAAVEYLTRAIASKGTEPAFHTNLGNAFKAQGKLTEALACHRRALVLQPDFPEAHYNLGNVLQSLGRSQEAI